MTALRSKLHHLLRQNMAIDTTTHSPGPWMRHGFNGFDLTLGIDIEPRTETSSGPVIARVHVTNRNEQARQRAEANANLIAAAPDMIAFVTHWRDVILGSDKYETLQGWEQEFVDHANQIIAKTKGK